MSEGQTSAAVVRATDVVHRRANFLYTDGVRYDGCWLDGMRHGEGEMTWKDRTSYIGDWVENERVGEGVLTYNTGMVSVLMFANSIVSILALLSIGFSMFQE